MLQTAGRQTAMIGKWRLVCDPGGFSHWDVLPGQGRYYSSSVLLSREGRNVEPGYVNDVSPRSRSTASRRNVTRSGRSS
jgi:hypothetical protein